MATYKKNIQWSLITAIVTFTYAVSTTSAVAKSRGSTYVCHFGHYGRVVIDTRQPGASITVKKRKYPTSSGSYFYQADKNNIIVVFNPTRTRWGYVDSRIDPMLNPIYDHHCSRRRT